MADERHLLDVDDHRKTAGNEILALMDQFGLTSYAAGWLHDRPTVSWRFFISTPVIDIKGPLWVYSRLLKAFRHYPLPDAISPLDLFVISPSIETALFSQPGFHDIRFGDTKPVTVGELGLMFLQEVKIENFEISDGFVSFYRRLADKDRTLGDGAARLFERKVGRLLAA